MGGQLSHAYSIMTTVLAGAISQSYITEVLYICQVLHNTRVLFGGPQTSVTHSAANRVGRSASDAPVTLRSTASTRRPRQNS